MTTLGAVGELDINGTWTDVSSYIYQGDRGNIAITRGRQNEASTISPAQCNFTLNNRDNRFTVRNPAGTYYPNLVQNTPFRVSVPSSNVGISCYLRLENDNTSYISAPDSAGLQITGTLDVRIDCQLSDNRPAILMGKWGATAKSWMFTLNQQFTNLNFTAAGSNYFSSDGTLGFFWYNGTDILWINSTAPLPYYNQRIALRALFDPGTNKTCTFYYSTTMAGSWTQLGDVVPLGSTSLANGSGQAVTVGGGPTQSITADLGTLTLNGMQGNVYEAKILSGVTTKADPVFTSQTAGASSFSDAQSNTWTLQGTSELSAKLYRFHGEMSSFPQASDPSATDVYSNATASGMFRRLSQGNTPAGSPFYRAMIHYTGASTPYAYWSMEDGANSTQFASGQASGLPMTWSGGTPTLASNSSFVSSSPLPVLNGATAEGFVVTPSGGTWTDNIIRFHLQVPSGGETTNTTLATIYTNGTAAKMTFVYTTASNGSLNLSLFNSAGSGLTGGSSGAVAWGINGQLARVSLEITASGGNINWKIATIAQGSETVSLSSGSVTGASIGAVTSVKLNTVSSAIGHLTVQPKLDSLFATLFPFDAWNSEPASTRFARICGEEGVNCRIVGADMSSVQMGYQPIDTFTNILQDCENTDMGYMFEPRSSLAIGYRTRASMYSQPVLSQIDYSQQQLAAGFTSTADDQLVVNDVTAQTTKGSTARQVLATGAMSINAPPNGISRIDTQISVNPYLDSELASIANWYLSVRSVDTDRYPGIPFQMNRTETPTSVALLDIGDHLQIINTPAWIPPYPIDQLCAGFSEQLCPATLWLINVNGVPETPYEVAFVGSGRVDTAGSQVNSSYTYGATTLSVKTTSGGSSLWTTASSAYPLYIKVNGMILRVTAVSSTSSPQTFTVDNHSYNGVQINLSTGANINIANYNSQQTVAGQ